MKYSVFSIGSGLFPANTVFSGKPGTDALRDVWGIVHLLHRNLLSLFHFWYSVIGYWVLIGD